MTPTTRSRRRSADSPTAAERRDIERRIQLMPLMRRDAPGVFDWPAIAGRLAEELTATTRRLAGAAQVSEQDGEQIARAEVVLLDYRRAVAADGVDE